MDHLSELAGGAEPPVHSAGAAGLSEPAPALNNDARARA
jgi:hypothetical protein